MRVWGENNVIEQIASLFSFVLRDCIIYWHSYAEMPCFLPVVIMRRFVFLMMQCCVVMSASCPTDMNEDHRPRVSCVNQSLTTVPDGIEPDTQVLVLTGNHFSSLSWSSYSGFTELHELDLSHNLITTLEPPGKPQHCS